MSAVCHPNFIANAMERAKKNNNDKVSYYTASFQQQLQHHREKTAYISSSVSFFLHRTRQAHKQQKRKQSKLKQNKTNRKNVKCFPFSLLYVYIDFIVIDKNSHFLRFRKLKREAEGKYCNRSTFYNRRKSFFLCLSAEKLWHCLCAIISSGEISRE